MKNWNKKYYIGSLIIVFAIALRLISVGMDWYNFAPLVGIALFSGFLFKKSSWAYLIPFIIYFISDVLLEVFYGTGFYGFSQFFVYGAMALVVLLGNSIKKPKALNLLGFAVSGSLLFWIISNLGVFLAGYYGYSFAGLIQTYLMAIPFYTPMGTELFFNAIVGDVLYTFATFGLFYLFALKSDLAIQENKIS
ncbi:MAG TPA: DUF6580 family putative transport protein [Chitinophagaceae bacterium]|nr:DUF6580 family putative transport protein [Chitinophagaceae bacterium]